VSSHFVPDLIEELRLALRVATVLRGQSNAHREHVVNFEAGRNPAQPERAQGHRSGAGQHHERNRALNAHEHRGKAE